MKTREDYLRYEAAACTLAAAAETPEEREYFLGRADLHRARANELPSPAADGGIDDSPEPTVITPQGPIPFSQIPEALQAMRDRWSDGPSLVELDAYGDFAPERSSHPWTGQGGLVPVFQIPQTCRCADIAGEMIRVAALQTEPYPQEWLDRAAAELARQLHGGPADADDIKLASEVLAAALGGPTAEET